MVESSTAATIINTTSEETSPLTDEMQLKKRSLDEFQILRDLGQGAYGKVFLGRDKKTDKIVAIKSVNKEQII
jgi:serine/threonine protein kinase